MWKPLKTKGFLLWRKTKFKPVLQTGWNSSTVLKGKDPIEDSFDKTPLLPLNKRGTKHTQQCVKHFSLREASFIFKSQLVNLLKLIFNLKSEKSDTTTGT